MVESCFRSRVVANANRDLTGRVYRISYGKIFALRTGRRKASCGFGALPGWAVSKTNRVEESIFGALAGGCVKKRGPSAPSKYDNQASECDEGESPIDRRPTMNRRRRAGGVCRRGVGCGHVDKGLRTL